MTLQFPTIGKRKSYAEVLACYEQGLFTCGFLWSIAEHDEVFAAFLRKHEVPKQ